MNMQLCGSCFGFLTGPPEPQTLAFKHFAKELLVEAGRSAACNNFTSTVASSTLQPGPPMMACSIDASSAKHIPYKPPIYIYIYI
jgi:hypothetical protein